MLRDDGRGRGCSTSTELTGSSLNSFFCMSATAKKFFVARRITKNWIGWKKGEGGGGGGRILRMRGRGGEDGLIG